MVLLRKSVINMRENNRVFVAAWEYPPIMSGESVVCRRLLEHSKYNYDVCCGPGDSNGNEHIRLFPVNGNKYLHWPFSCVKIFSRMDKDEHYRVIMSRVMPPNGHLAGLFIKVKNPSLKWIVYFSDPIWNSPFLRFSLHDDGTHRPSWLLMKVFGIPAKLAIHFGDVLMFNNLRLAKYVLGEKYGKYKDKVLIVPYGHEGIFPKPQKHRDDNKILLTHVGQLYGDRTLKALIAGLEELKKESPENYKKIHIRQVGFASETEKQRVYNSTVSEAFTFIPQVPYLQSIEEMYQADCLLEIDPVFDRKEKNIYVPGKLFDYMSTGKPILCIADSDSVTGNIAREIGCVCVSSESKDDVCEALRMLTDSRMPAVDAEAYARLSCRNGSEKLDAVLKRCF